jgi:hypothetical protein
MSLLHSVQTFSQTHPSSYPKVNVFLSQCVLETERLNGRLGMDERIILKYALKGYSSIFGFIRLRIGMGLAK